MNRIYLLLIVLTLFSGACVRAVDSATSGRPMPIDLIQKIDMREAFEAVYTIALEQGTLDKLPSCFVNCLTAMREGSRELNSSEFMASLAYVVETLLVTRDFAERYTSRPCKYCEARIRQLEGDIAEVFEHLDDRLHVVEILCGVGG